MSSTLSSLVDALKSRVRRKFGVSSEDNLDYEPQSATFARALLNGRGEVLVDTSGLESADEVPAAIGAESPSGAQAKADAAQAAAISAAATDATTKVNAAKSEAIAEAAEDAEEKVSVETAARISADAGKVDIDGSNLGAASVGLAALKSEVTDVLNGPLDPSKYLGEITSASQAITAAATAGAGAWYSIAFDSGTLSGTNAPSVAVVRGDSIIVNAGASAYVKRALPPTNVPDGSILYAKLASDTTEKMAEADAADEFSRVWADRETKAVSFGAYKDDGTLFGIFRALQMPGASREESSDEIDDSEYIYALADRTTRGIYFAIRRDLTIEGSPGDVAALAAEIGSARGTAATLADRIDFATTAAGHPKRHLWNEGILRDWRTAKRNRLAGNTATISLILVGDSWTASYPYFIEPFTRALKARLGNAGPGFFQFANSSTTCIGCADSAEATGTRSAGWAANSNSALTGSPSMVELNGGTGETITVNVVTPCTVAKLLYGQGPSYGTFRYRFDSGSWTTIDSNGSSSVQAASLSGVPAGAFTLSIEVLTGTVHLYGVDLQNSASGIRVHRCAYPGIHTGSYQTSTLWASGLAALAPTAALVMLGTNDSNPANSISASTYGTNMATIIAKLRTARGAMDIGLIAPAKNGAYNDISPYRDALLSQAAASRCAFLDLVTVFGETFSEYNSAGIRPLFLGDNIHPNSSGGILIADAALELLNLN